MAFVTGYLERRIGQRGKLEMTAEFLLDQLNLPKDTILRGVEYNVDRDIVTVYVNHPELEALPEGCESPVVGYVIKGEWIR